MSIDYRHIVGRRGLRLAWARELVLVSSLNVVFDLVGLVLLIDWCGRRLGFRSESRRGRFWYVIKSRWLRFADGSRSTGVIAWRSLREKSGLHNSGSGVWGGFHRQNFMTSIPSWLSCIRYDDVLNLILISRIFFKHNVGTFYIFFHALLNLSWIHSYMIWDKKKRSFGILQDIFDVFCFQVC